MDRRQGIVVRFHSNIVTVEDALTQKRFMCSLRGRFKTQNIRPIIGDVVEYIGFRETVAGASPGVEAMPAGRIENIFPRRNVLDRPNIANIDQVLLVTSLKYPEVSAFIVDRFLVLAERNSLEVCLVINKIDLLDREGRERLEQYVAYYSKDYTVIPVSAKTGEGILEVSSVLSGKISTLAGMSGVGKSTVLNQIDPSLGLKEGEISKQLEVGKHTTTYSELLPVANKGLVADTPGFANLSLTHIPSDELKFCFPEFVRAGSHCYYEDCLHIDEPGCRVHEQVDQGEILLSRYENYLQMVRELVDFERIHPINKYQKEKR
ncbi:MAG TPA: ribosome small subunit-dependent GTPase A [Thermotogota bacterium]|nr:ribosome small subunit-dependent GTPase A [Thermotogota bacterium]NLZ12970.1 ribosome small subunit-dependent GTPase A [Thermotogaceae bacterium]MDD8041160.1 ribosome small subunit-dependent GTPase A [Thermotogota bacterium]MDD8052585.1 ribosome small subunit-dependent GTPase A [Thermotogota bacterium]HNR63168.1 ribosome small subunit-dependent GTPase A [Thermotogota bacterium]